MCVCVVCVCVCVCVCGVCVTYATAKRVFGQAWTKECCASLARPKRFENLRMKLQYVGIGREGAPVRSIGAECVRSRGQDRKPKLVLWKPISLGEQAGLVHQHARHMGHDAHLNYNHHTSSPLRHGLSPEQLFLCLNCISAGRGRGQGSDSSAGLTSSSRLDKALCKAQQCVLVSWMADVVIWPQQI